ncbi:MAG: hypothetical protein ACP6IS_00860 [Candidatus Asgardarchaeia archaeon]
MKLQVAGSVLVVIFALLMFYFVYTLVPGIYIPSLDFATYMMPRLVPSYDIESIIQSVSTMLWSTRVVDVLGQSALLLITALGVTVLLKKR